MFKREWKNFFTERGYELINEAHFSDESKKSKEGVIPHSSYILKIKPEIYETS